MRILMLAPGNVPHSLKPLNWLLEQGHEVIFIDGENPFPKGRERFLFIPYVHSDDTFVIAMLQAINRELQPQLVHVHWIDHRAYQCMEAHLKPLVLTAWGSDINNYFTNLTNSQFLLPPSKMAETLRYAHTIFVDTPDIQTKCQTLAAAPIQTQFLTPGVNTLLFKPGYENESSRLRQLLHISAQTKVLFSIRAMRPVYNHHLILFAFFYALPRFQNKSVLLFKRYNNRDFKDYEKALMQLIQKLQLSQYVKFLDDVPSQKVPVLYALSHVIINYPAIDAFPVTFLEAAACKRQVITNSLPAYQNTFAEQFFHVIPHQNMRALSQAIVDAVNVPITHHHETLSNARSLVIQQFDESICAKQLITHYNHLISLHHTSVSTYSKSLHYFPSNHYLEIGLKALQLSPQKTDLDNYRLGSLFQRLQKFSQAQSCFEEVLQSSSQNKLIAGACFHLAEIFLAKKRNKDAALIINRCLEVDPNHRAAALLKESLPTPLTSIHSQE